MIKNKYIDEANYSDMVIDQPSIDDQLKELNQLCSQGVDDYQLYLKIRDYVFCEIKIEELAVTKILQDLMEIKNLRQSSFEKIVYFICHSDQSYQKMGQALGCTGQAVHSSLMRASSNFPWLNNLLHIKSAADSKNKKRAIK